MINSSTPFYNEFDRCDVLVNNAGMSPLYDDLASVTEELYDKVHKVNARGPFRLVPSSEQGWPRWTAAPSST